MRLCDVFLEVYQHLETQDKNFNDITEFLNKLCGRIKVSQIFPIMNVNQNKIIYDTFQKVRIFIIGLFLLKFQVKKLLDPLAQFQQNYAYNNLKRPSVDSAEENLLSKKPRISGNTYFYFFYKGFLLHNFFY